MKTLLALILSIILLLSPSVYSGDISIFVVSHTGNKCLPKYPGYSFRRSYNGILYNTQGTTTSWACPLSDYNIEPHNFDDDVVFIGMYVIDQHYYENITCYFKGYRVTGLAQNIYYSVRSTSGSNSSSKYLSFHDYNPEINYVERYLLRCNIPGSYEDNLSGIINYTYYQN